MSSIVSRSPPPSGSTSQEKDFFWMSMRLGTSRTLSSRAKLRRVRGASTEAKTATPHGAERNGQGAMRRPLDEPRGGRPATESATSQYNTGVGGPLEGRSALTDPV